MKHAANDSKLTPWTWICTWTCTCPLNRIDRLRWRWSRPWDWWKMNREVFAGTQCPLSSPLPYFLKTLVLFSWPILFLIILNQLPPFFLTSYILFFLYFILTCWGEMYIAFTLLVCILFYSTFALHCIARRVWIRNDWLDGLPWRWNYIPSTS